MMFWHCQTSVELRCTGFKALSNGPTSLLGRPTAAAAAAHSECSTVRASCLQKLLGCFFREAYSKVALAVVFYLP